jgi:RNA polymerase sigma factor (sigma-70 family)
MSLAKQGLRPFIEREAHTLLPTLRLYLWRAGLASHGQALDAAAAELLNEVTVQALKHEARFVPQASPRAWLLGIAANLIKRRRAEAARLNQREPLARDLHADGDDAHLTEEDVFDQLLALRDPHTPPHGALPQVEAILAPLSAEDARIVRMAIIYEMDGAALGAQLGISAAAARVRLHRALGRLRKAYPTIKEFDDA